MKRIDEIFEIRYGNSLELLNCEEAAGGIPFVSRTSSNNGITAYVRPVYDVEPMPAHAISVALSGTVLSAFFQSRRFYTAFHIACLYPKVGLSTEEMLFYCAAIEKNKYRYNYGRQANKTLRSILVPAPNEIPKYVSKHTVASPFVKEPLVDKRIELHPERWKWFRYDEIFEIKKGKRLTKEDMTQGTIPFIGSTELHNGVTASIETDEHLHPSNTITVSYNGSIGYAFYQPLEYSASDDINVLYPRFSLNKYIAMFLVSLIEKEQYRFCYGRKWHKEKMQQSLIKLPVTSQGEPDWEFMETYIKSLPYSGNL